MSKREHSDTAAVHAGSFEIPENAPSSPPLFQSSSYEFADLEQVDAIYEGARSGAIYGRYGAPNTRHFESIVAELDRAPAAVGAASGMAAIGAALFTNLRRGDRVVAGAELYGGTYDLLENDLQERGIEVAYVDQTDQEAVAKAVQAAPTRLLYVEALTNPLVRVPDIPALARLAKAHGALLVVDATFATPVLFRPYEHGAGLVVHSVGKYLGGHADVGAGVLAGDAERIAAARNYLVRNGAPLAHFEAWLAVRGIRTLALRMERHSANARRVAEFLSGVDGVAAVHHPSRPDHPQHDLAARLYPAGTGGMLAFEIRGGRAAVERFLAGLKRIRIVHSLGEIASTISYSALSSHRALPPEVRAQLGVNDGTLRLSTGIEHPDDIIADLRTAFAGLYQRVRA